MDPSKCYVTFMDCLGYYDLAAELINCILATLILYKSISNYRHQYTEYSSLLEDEPKASIKRKLVVNLILIVYGSVLLVSIGFSMVLFQVVTQDRDGLIQKRLNFWYKFVEMVYINIMNALLGTVGFLYWKALRAYYIIAQLPLPCRYTRPVKAWFILIYVCSVAFIAATLIILLSCSNTSENRKEIELIGEINFAGSALASFTCVGCRLLYYSQILKQTRMSIKNKRREYLYTVLIGVSCLLRLILYLLDITELNPSQKLRSFYNKDPASTSNCHDEWPYHALILIFITLVVDLMPGYLFLEIFGKSDKRGKKEQIEKTLWSAGSSEYSQMQRN